MLLDRIKDRNDKTRAILAEEESQLKESYLFHVNNRGIKSEKDFRNELLTRDSKHYRHTHSLKLSQDRVSKLIIDLASMSDNVSDAELSALFEKTFPHTPVSEDCGYSLVELLSGLETRLWNNLSEQDHDIRKRYRGAITRLLYDAVDEEYFSVFVASILNSTFKQRDVEVLMRNLISRSGYINYATAETNLRQAIQNAP